MPPVDSLRCFREHPTSVTAGELSRFCANHRDRNASSLCVQCRRAMCHECSTRWEGINYCVTCLAVQRRSVVRARSRFGWLPLTIAAALLLTSFAYALVWMGALIMELF